MIVARLMHALCLSLGLLITAEPALAQRVGLTSLDPFDCPPSMYKLLSTIDSGYLPTAVPDYAKKLILEAKRLDKSAISSVGGYFREGSRGLPKDERYGFCLIYWNFRSGYAVDAYEVGKKYEQLGKYPEASRHYGITFGYWAVSEALNYGLGLDDPLEADVKIAHMAYAAAHALVARKLLSETVMWEEFNVGRLMGIGMTADLQRMKRALRELR